MDFDYRNRANPPYDSNLPPYARSSPSGASAMYPRVGPPGQPLAPPVARTSSHHHPPSSPSSGLGIRVAIKPEYRITPPPQLAPIVADVPRCIFQFDFEFERKVLAEAEKDRQNWDKIAEIHSPKTGESIPSAGSTSAPSGDPTINKYVASGLGREAVTLGVANYGDNPSKVREFVNAYNLLREMGFSSKNVAEVLAMYDNDTDKALAHFLNSSS